MASYTELAISLFLLSTYSWCVVSALAPLYSGYRRIIQVDAEHWWWIEERHPDMNTGGGLRRDTLI